MNKRCASLSLMLACLLLGGCGFLTPVEETARVYIWHHQEKLYYAHTSDNWDIALHRLQPAEPNGAPPVVVCHGLSYNSHFWDADERHDFGQFLRERGYDVWLVDLRGCGDSSTPGWTLLHGPPKPERLLKLRFDKIDWNVDDIIMKDVPSVIDLVKKETGAKRVFWVGHSMGGIVLYGYLERFQRDDVAGLAALNSPMMLPLPPLKPLRDAAQFRFIVSVLNHRLPALVGTFVANQFPSPVDAVLYNPANMTPEVASHLCWTASEDVSNGLMDQMFHMVQEGELVSVDGAHFSYTQHLNRVRVPVLAVAGKLDNLCPPESVRFTYAHISSEHKKFILLARANGYAADYGHVDTVCGKNAPMDVYPMVAQWLDQAAGVRREKETGK